MCPVSKVLSFCFIYNFVLISLLQEYENKKDKTDEDVTTAAEAITANLTNAQNVMGIVNRLLTPNRRGRILLFTCSLLNSRVLMAFELHLDLSSFEDRSNAIKDYEVLFPIHPFFLSSLLFILSSLFIFYSFHYFLFSCFSFFR